MPPDVQVRDPRRGLRIIHLNNCKVIKRSEIVELPMAESKSEKKRKKEMKEPDNSIAVPPPNNTLQHDVERTNDDGRCVYDTTVNDTEAPDGDETVMME